MADKPTGRTTENIIKLVSAGASVSFDASNKTMDSLIQIAREAAAARVTVTFRNLDGKTLDALLSINTAGKGYVVLHF